MRAFVLCFALVANCLALTMMVTGCHESKQSSKTVSKKETQEVKAKTNRVLDFTADWCPPCKDMERYVWSQRSVKNALTWYKGEDREIVDLTDGRPKALAEKYNITSIPTIIIIDSDGKVLYRQSKYHTADELVRVLKKYR